MTKVTILIAVYNSEQFIRQCLDSLVAQTLDDWQAICIDDCSTDSSLSILEEYAGRDNRFEVIHLAENEGQGHARNVGLRQAKGEYTCFLDSDDWFSPNALEQAVECFERYPQTDSVLFRVVNKYADHDEPYPSKPFAVKMGEEAFRDSLTWSIHGIYMVRTCIHQEYPYDETSHSFSDDNTTRLHYLRSREVRCCDGTYFYRMHNASTTHQITALRFDYLKANESMKQQLVKMQVDDSLISLYEDVRWENLIGMYMFYYQNRHILSPQEASYGLAEIHRVWCGIEVHRLKRKGILHKFGYMPLHFSWFLFRLQEELYFFLRFALKGR